MRDDNGEHLDPWSRAEGRDEQGDGAEDAIPPELRQYLEQLYQGAWEAYAEAGYPFGRSDDAMLIWYEFDRQTRAN